MAHYEKQGKQEAAYPIPISLPPVLHCPVTVLQRYREGVCSLLFPLIFIMCQSYISFHFGIYFLHLFHLLFGCIVATITGASPQEKNQWWFKTRVIDCVRSCCVGKVGVAHDRKWCRSLLCHADDKDFHWRREMQE